MDGYTTASAGKGEKLRSGFLEEQAIKKAENLERAQNQQMNLQRRKRLQQEYKAVLIQQLYAKEGRHNLIKEKRNQVSSKGYQQSVALRDQFAATSSTTIDRLQPVPFE